MRHNGAWVTMTQAKDSKCVMTIDCKRYSAGRKFWVAKITGKDSKYGLSREFVQGFNYGTRILDSGIYEVYNCPRANAADYERYFLQVYPTGESQEIQYAEVINHIDGVQTTPTMVLTDAMPF